MLIQTIQNALILLTNYHLNVINVFRIIIQELMANALVSQKQLIIVCTMNPIPNVNNVNWDMFLWKIKRVLNLIYLILIQNVLIFKKLMKVNAKFVTLDILWIWIIAVHNVLLRIVLCVILLMLANVGFVCLIVIWIKN